MLTPAAILSDLRELALNLWWSWNAEGQLLWGLVAMVLDEGRRFRETLDPMAALREIRPRHLAKLASWTDYQRTHRHVLGRFRAELRRPRRGAHGLSRERPVAYFSMEYGVHESLPIYAGGLGVLAGDHVKSASDENVPLVGVGLFYRKGYFRQEIDAAGRQKVLFSTAAPGRLPLEVVRGGGGKELRVGVELPGRTLRLRLWRLRAGRTDVYLLDPDVPENRPRDRKLCYRLYSSPREERIEQEIVAGVGGVRALGALGIRPGAWHLNEGHVAFLTLERLRQAREELRLDLAAALEVVAADTIFTTHTPVPEGNEVFDLALASRSLAPAAAAAGIPVEEYLALGLDQAPDGRPVLSMTVLALRLSRHRNGVSALHGEVSRRMWRHLWPGFRAEEAPIGSVTNGVHVPTWAAMGLDLLCRWHVGDDWRERLDDRAFWKRVRRIPDAELWNAKKVLKEALVHFVREREARRLRREGWSRRRIEARVSRLLDPEAFTIGFARRFALYKRSALIFRDLARARRLFASRARPLQIVFAGKPHPDDAQGKAVLEKIAAIARRPGFRGKVVVLEGYDLEVARRLVQGADLWLNNPRRPLEASGTSGQKVSINGGLNFSTLDGWWCEGHSAATGWAIGKPVEYTDLETQDRDDAADLHRVLEREILPLYYRRDRNGVPRPWLRKVKAAMADLVPRFSSARMVREYAARFYRPAVENGEALRRRGGRAARELVAWKDAVCRSWPLVHVRTPARAAGAALEVDVFAGAIPPGSFACLGDDGKERPVRLVETLDDGLHRFRIARAGGASSLRLFPRHPLLVHPQELGLALEMVL